MAENKQGGKFEISPKAAIQIAQQYQVLGLMTGRRLYEEVIREDLKDFGACSKRRTEIKKAHTGLFSFKQNLLNTIKHPLELSLGHYLSKKPYLINPDNTITAYSHTPDRDTIIASTPSSKILGCPLPPPP
ncbi:hypothetical protein JS81_08925 [Thermoactinomyces sp. Gus2-1]|jgi:hypothetical protein|nr:hypothetical protein JS81_08925 [Thermoactinomyces sp. Gus2-1]